MNETLRRALMRAPYVLGGRSVEGIDCLGITLFISALRGRPIGDPWGNIKRHWCDANLDVSNGFPDGWERIDSNARLIDGDVMLFDGVHPWVAIVHEGYVWSANQPSNGVYRKSVAQWASRPRELWRFKQC